MNTNTEDLLTKATQEQQDLLLSPETSRTVASIAHANHLADESIVALHAEIALLILGQSNIDRDRISITNSLTSAGVKPEIAPQVLSDINSYILKKQSKSNNAVESKIISPVSTSAEVKFVPKVITPSSANAIPMVTSDDGKATIPEQKNKPESTTLDPYREGMI